jgi:hypothetical protein
VDVERLWRVSNLEWIPEGSILNWRSWLGVVPALRVLALGVWS